jgi:hypothetical protein
MELTGKCEVAFENYKWKHLDSNKESKIIWAHSYPFKDFPDSMKYGEYVDFFDSVDIRLHVWIEEDNKSTWGFIIFAQIIEEWTNINSRHKARTEAIKKANEIYNLRF